MIHNRTLHHINVMVPDLEKALAFYTEMMQFQITDTFTGNGMKFIFITDGTITYELLENKEINEARFDHVAYESDDIQADYEYFYNKNPKVLMGEIQTIDFLFEHGVDYFFVQGPGNEKIEFCQRRV